jgi:hypothetical protein
LTGAAPHAVYVGRCGGRFLEYVPAGPHAVALVVVDFVVFVAVPALALALVVVLALVLV